MNFLTFYYVQVCVGQFLKKQRMHFLLFLMYDHLDFKTIETLTRKYPFMR